MPAWPVAVFGLAVLLAAAYLISPLPLGFPGQWTYGRAPTSRWAGVPVPAALLALTLLLISLRHGAPSSRLVAACWVVGLAVLCIALSVVAQACLSDFGLGGAAFVSRLYNNDGVYYMEARRITSPVAYVAGFAERLDERPSGKVFRVETHPPGFTVEFYLIRRAYMDSPWFKGLLQSVSSVGASSEPLRARESDEPNARAVACGVTLLHVVAAATGVILAYLLARQFLAREEAIACAACFSLSPGVLAFFGESSQLLIPLGGAVVLCSVTAIERGSVVSGILAAAFLSAGLFFSAAFLALGFFCVLYATLRLIQLRREAPSPLGRLRWLAAGASCLTFAAAHLLLWGVFRYDAATVILKCLANNELFYTQYQRTRAVWAVLTPLELGMSLGAGLAALILATAINWLLRSLASRRLESVRPLALALAATLVALVLSGSVRGETARNLLLFAPAATVVAWVGLLDTWTVSRRFHLVVIISQGVLALLTLATTDPMFVASTLRGIVNGTVPF